MSDEKADELLAKYQSALQSTRDLTERTIVYYQGQLKAFEELMSKNLSPRELSDECLKLNIGLGKDANDAGRRYQNHLFKMGIYPVRYEDVKPKPKKNEVRPVEENPKKRVREEPASEDPSSSSARQKRTRAMERIRAMKKIMSEEKKRELDQQYLDEEGKAWRLRYTRDNY